MFALNHGPNDKVGHEALIPSVKSQIAIGFLTGPLSAVVMCLTADPEVASSIPVWSRSDVHATLCEIKIDDLKKTPHQDIPDGIFWIGPWHPIDLFVIPTL